KAIQAYGGRHTVRWSRVRRNRTESMSRETEPAAAAVQADLQKAAEDNSGIWRTPYSEREPRKAESNREEEQRSRVSGCHRASWLAKGGRRQFRHMAETIRQQEVTRIELYHSCVFKKGKCGKYKRHPCKIRVRSGCCLSDGIQSASVCGDVE